MKTDKVAVTVDGQALTLTNLAKVLYPQDGVTKAEVLDYYHRISPVLLPHVAGRPVTLKRYPEGVDGQSFFQKHAPVGTPDWVRTVDVPSQSSRGRGDMVTHVVIDDLPTLMWAANLAALELHAPMWQVPAGAAARAAGAAAAAAAGGAGGAGGAAGAGDSAGAAGAAGAGDSAGAGEPRPDLIVFDLDPGEPATIVECCRVAEALRPMLADAGLVALPKTSGGKGLQLYARISGVSPDEASEQAKGFARALERARPDLVTSRMTRSLRAGKIFIDWSQNNGSKTTIAPYSLRARARPTVSTPVTWDEVAACAAPEDLIFTATDVPGRVTASGDLFGGLL